MLQLYETGETVRESQQQQGILRDMQQLCGTWREIERQRETIGDSERHAATPWDWRDGERQNATTRDSERDVATL